MPREINLLPLPLQLRRRRRIYLARLGRLLRHVMGVLLTGLLVVGGAYLVAERVKRVTVDAVQHDDSQQQALLEEMRRVNAQLGAVRQWREDHEPWLPQVEAALQELPAEVRLRAVAVTAAEDALELRGVFTSREALTLFQRRLEALPWVASVRAPLSNFATGEDNEFSLTLVRKTPTP